MNTLEARKIVKRLDQDVRDALEEAFVRFLFMANLIEVEPGQDEERATAEQDRIDYAPFIPGKDENGEVVIKDESTKFLNAITGIDMETCEAWELNDLYVTNGIVFD